MSQWVEAGSASGGGATVSETPPSSPSEGEEWLDTSYRKPERKVYLNGSWVVTNKGSNVPPKQVLTSPDTFDVSDATSVVEVEAKGGRGGNGSGQFSAPGGSCGAILAEIDLSYHDTLNVHFNSGRSGGSGRGGHGGTGVEITDGDGTRLVGAGGGGGGEGSWDGGTRGHYGGRGGGPHGGHAGGKGDHNPDSGGDGGTSTNYESTTKKSTTRNNQGASVELFL